MNSVELLAVRARTVPLTLGRIVASKAYVAVLNAATCPRAALSTVVKSPPTMTFAPSGVAVIARPWPLREWLKPVTRFPVRMS